MLKIKGALVPDLRNEQALGQYAAEISAAFEDLILNSGEEKLPEEERRAMMERLIRWSYNDDDKESFPSWKFAVRAARAAVVQGSLLGVARMDTAKDRDQSKFDMAMGSVQWSNCGRTAANLLDALRPSVDGLHQAIQTAKPVMHRPGQGAQLTTMLREIPKAGHILLFDCSLPAVHTFLVEVHPNGARYLSQGYQGAYFANWWANKDPAGLRLDPNKIPATEMQLLVQMRDDYGKGRTMGSAPYLRMTETLGQALDAARIAATDERLEVKSEKQEEDLTYRQSVVESRLAWSAFAAHWKALPFCPLQREVESITHRGGTPAVQVTRYAIPDLSTGTGTSVTVPLIPDVIR